MTVNDYPRSHPFSHDLHLSINKVEIVDGYYEGMNLSSGSELRAQQTIL